MEEAQATHLDAQADGLQLGAHLIELLNVLSCSYKILRHNAYGVLAAR